MAVELKKLQTPTYKEMFVTQIEHMIISGEFEIGQKLPSEREVISLAADDDRNTFKVKGLPAGADANDRDAVPSFYRNRFKNMGSSIDLSLD